MKVGFPTDKIHIKNKGIDLQQQNHALVFGNGENFCNFKETKSSHIKVISIDEFLLVHLVKFQLCKQQQILVINKFFLMLNWTNNQLRNRRP